MRPHVIVMAPPDFDEDARFGAAAKPFHAQALVAELAVEALVVAVLPRLAGIDQGGVDLRFGEPFQDRLAHELGPLSERRNAGAPCALIRRVSTSMTRAERMLPATSMAWHSRVNSSMMVRHLIFCPLAQAS